MKTLEPGGIPHVLGVFVIMTMLFIMAPQLAEAASVSWDGGGDGQTWSDCNNWTGDTCPSADDDITIGAGFLVQELTVPIALSSQGFLTIEAGAALNIAIDFDNDGTTINDGTLESTCCFATLENGRLENSGTIVVASSSQFDNEGVLLNTGQLQNDPGSTINNLGAIFNFGTIFNDQEAEINSVLDDQCNVVVICGLIYNQCGGTISVFDPGATIANVLQEPCELYTLYLLENFEPSDNVVDLGQTVVAAGTENVDDPLLTAATFRWIDPNGNVDHTVIAGSDFGTAISAFVPDETGTWIVEADFGNGQILRTTLDISFFVVPESPIGAISMSVTSVAILGSFMYFRSRKSASINSSAS